MRPIICISMVLFLGLTSCTTRSEPIKGVHLQVQGTVRIGTGSPAIGVTVRLNKDIGSTLPDLITITEATTTTNSLGHYEFDSIIEYKGRLYVWAVKTGYMCAPKSVEWVENMQTVDLILVHPPWDPWPSVVLPLTVY